LLVLLVEARPDALGRLTARLLRLLELLAIDLRLGALVPALAILLSAARTTTGPTGAAEDDVAVLVDGRIRTSRPWSRRHST